MTASLAAFICSFSFAVSQYWCCWWLTFDFVSFTAHFITVLQLDNHYCRALLRNIAKLAPKPVTGFLVWLYLRKLSCWCGRGEGVGHHGAEYIQVVVVLACARATIVGRCSCRRVCDRKAEKPALQVEKKVCSASKANPERLFQQNTDELTHDFLMIFYLNSLRNYERS